MSAISADIDAWLQQSPPADEPANGNCDSARQAAATLQAVLSEHRRLIQQQSSLREQLAERRRDVYEMLEKIQAGCACPRTDREHSDLPASAA